MNEQEVDLLQRMGPGIRNNQDKSSLKQYSNVLDTYRNNSQKIMDKFPHDTINNLPYNEQMRLENNYEMAQNMLKQIHLVSNLINKRLRELDNREVGGSSKKTKRNKKSKSKKTKSKKSKKSKNSRK